MKYSTIIIYYIHETGEVIPSYKIERGEYYVIHKKTEYKKSNVANEDVLIKTIINQVKKNNQLKLF